MHPTPPAKPAPSAALSLPALPHSCLVAVLECLTVEELLITSLVCKGLQQALQDELLWRNLAIRKWGPHVASLAPPPPPQGWRAYCRKRLSLRPIKRSPLCLIQEAYPDPWQHIMCCVLCSRTSGSGVVVAAVQGLLAAWPTPSALLAAEEGVLREALHPLGLQDVRLAAVRGLSRDFLETDWDDPSAFKGCGPFVRDSWRIFCCGRTDAKDVSDANLKRYLNWLKGASTGATWEEQQAAAAAAAARKAAAAARSAAKAAAAFEKCAAGGGRVTRGQLQQALGGGRRAAGPLSSSNGSSRRQSTKAAAGHAAAGGGVGGCDVAAGRDQQGSRRSRGAGAAAGQPVQCKQLGSSSTGGGSGGRSSSSSSKRRKRR